MERIMTEKTFERIKKKHPCLANWNPNCSLAGDYFEYSNKPAPNEFRMEPRNYDYDDDEGAIWAMCLSRDGQIVSNKEFLPGITMLSDVNTRDSEWMLVHYVSAYQNIAQHKFVLHGLS